MTASTNSATRLPRDSSAAGACCLSSAVFIATYWLANDLTGMRSDIGSTVFAWEHRIPFVAWTIVPYLSIGVFFVLSFFVKSEPAELRRHMFRLLLVLLVAVICYALFPLRFTFDRPLIDGVFGPLYQALVWFDRPYNRAPSLHIAVLVLLWARFTPCRQAWQSLCLHAWFGLIAVSVLTTYQHHVIDVLAGFTLGAAVLGMRPPSSGGHRQAQHAGWVTAK
jgi:membrane-associated phospholipid phosphatase